MEAAPWDRAGAAGHSLGDGLVLAHFTYPRCMGLSVPIHHSSPFVDNTIIYPGDPFAYIQRSPHLQPDSTRAH